MTVKLMLHGENKRGELKVFNRMRVQSAKPYKNGFKIGVHFWQDFLDLQLLKERD